MINDQLLSYVKQQLSLNVGREAITANLKSQGWTDDDVNEAFRAITPVSAPASVPTPPVVSGVTPNLTQTQTNFSNTTHIKSKKLFFIVIIVLILLCMAGGGVYAYYSGVFVSLPKLVSESIDKTRVTTSVSYDTTTSVDFSEVKSINNTANSLLSGNFSSSKITATAKGSYDISNKNSVKSSMLLSIDGGNVSVAAEFRWLNDVLYGTLTKFPTAIVLFLPTISSYENKWFSVPFKSADGQAAKNPITSFTNVDISVTDKITLEQEEHLYQMIRDAHFIKAVKRFSPEIITGEMSYHFTFDLDREGISSYLQALKDYVNSIGKDDSSLSAFDPTSFSKQLDNLKDFTGEIWIGRNDKLLHKIVLNFGIQPDLTKNEQVKFSIVVIMSGWNQPVSITAPAESTPFETIISSIFSSSLGNARQKGKEAAIKANMSNMRVQAELFYAAHHNLYSGFCSSNELKNARKAIEDNGGTKFICLEAGQKYSIGVEMPSSTGYWCVDSTGFMKSTTTLPSSTVCPLK